jgi:non-specific protein-tyrosine kinase
MRTAVFMAVLGLLLTVGIIFGLDAIDDTIKDPDELSRQLALPILGVIASHSTGVGALSAIKNPRSPVTEAFRSLRTNVHFTGVDQPIRRLIITSPTPQDGKTTVSSNLAVVLAQSGLHVCLMDCDMRRPKIHTVMAVSNGNGLSGLFMQNKIDINSAVQPVAGVNGLRVLTAGVIPPNPSELLGSNKMKDIMDKLLEQDNILLLDTPPIVSVTDAAVLARQCDGVLIVFRPGVTKITVMKQAVEQLRRVNANVVGLVANNVNMERIGYGYYYYREYYNKYSYHHTPNQVVGWMPLLLQKLARLMGLKKV